MIVCPGQRRPDNMGVKTYLQFSDNGMWLTQEPSRRFSFQLRSHLLDYMYGWRNLDAYLLGLQHLVRSEFQNGSFWYQHVFISSSTSWTFLGFHIHYIQAGFLLLGIQFSTDRYNDPCLIKCAIHGGSDMVPWTHWREPKMGECWPTWPPNLHFYSPNSVATLKGLLR